MFDALAAEFHVGVHHIPVFGIEAVMRQYAVSGLAAFLAALRFRLRGFFVAAAAVDANQRAEIRHAQLARHHFAAQLRTRFTLGVGERAVNITVADMAVEVFIVINGAALLTEFHFQMAVGFIRRRIRQQHAGEIVEVRQRIAGEAHAQIEPAQIHRVLQAAGDIDARGAVAHFGLHRERRGFAAQREHAAELTAAVQTLIVISAAGAPAENEIGRALLLIVAARHLAVRHRFAQRIDFHFHIGFIHCVAVSEMHTVKQNVIKTE